MSSLTHESMTNHHVKGTFALMGETLQLWRQRYRSRQQLAGWSERDLHDVGLSWSDVVHEVDKPFWRA